MFRTCDRRGWSLRERERRLDINCPKHQSVQYRRGEFVGDRDGCHFLELELLWSQRRQYDRMLCARDCLQRCLWFLSRSDIPYRTKF